MFSRLDAGFHSALLGLYVPGKIIELHRTDVHPLLTKMHEATHQMLTQSTTLGVAAMLCGVIDVYSTDSALKTKVQPYLERYVSKCSWIQEGTATAFEITSAIGFAKTKVLPDCADDLLSSLPHNYLCAAQQVMTFSRRLWERLPGSDDIAGLMQALPALGIAATSPPLAPSFLDKVIAGDVLNLPELDASWARYQALLECDVDAVGERVKAEVPIFIPRVVETALEFRNSIVRALCATAGILYEEPPDFMDIARKYIPDLVKNIRVVSGTTVSKDALEEATNIFYWPLLKPSPINAGWIEREELAELIRSYEGLAVFEISAYQAPSIALTAHLFSKNGDYVQSAVCIYSQLDDRAVSDYKNISNVPRSAINGRLRGFVTALEMVEQHFGNFFDGVERVHLALFRPNYDDIGEQEFFGEDAGEQLVRISLRSRGDIWEVWPPSPRKQGALNANERAFKWVLRNGFCARLRWGNYHNEEGVPHE